MIIFLKTIYKLGKWVYYLAIESEQTEERSGMQCLSAILILSPYNQKPLQLGADFVVEALTKFINGHGDAQGGAIISNDLAAMDRIRYEAQVNVGSVISPFNAWQIFRGCVTFPLRMQRINESAGIIVQWLETRAHVTFVSYPGLESSPSHELACKQMENGLFGGILSFELKDDVKGLSSFEAGKKLLNNLTIPAIAVSLGDPDTLIEHPASMTHAGVSPADRLAAGITDGLVRLSVGLESAKDLINDFEQAFAKI